MASGPLLPSASSPCKYLSRPLLIRALRHARLKRSAVVLVTAGPNSAELAAYCRQRGLFPEKVDRWR